MLLIEVPATKAENLIHHSAEILGYSVLALLLLVLTLCLCYYACWKRLWIFLRHRIQTSDVERPPQPAVTQLTTPPVVSRKHGNPPSPTCKSRRSSTPL